jgi:hypothetical protein
LSQTYIKITYAHLYVRKFFTGDTYIHEPKREQRARERKERGGEERRERRRGKGREEWEDEWWESGGERGGEDIKGIKGKGIGIKTQPWIFFDQ